MRIYLPLFILFLGTFNFAQILSYSTNDTIVIDLNSTTTVIKDIDLNLDGVRDMSLQLSASSSNICALYGISDSSDILHRYFQYTGTSGHEAIEMTDSIISNQRNWMALNNGGSNFNTGVGVMFNSFSTYVNHLASSNFYLGFRFFQMDSDLILKPHYGCMEFTMSGTQTLTLHGWAYNSTPNESITCSSSILNSLSIEDNIKESKLRAFPNPSVNGIFELNTLSSKVEVYNVSGVKSSIEVINSSIDLSMLSKGIYFVKDHENICKVIIK